MYITFTFLFHPKEIFNLFFGRARNNSAAQVTRSLTCLMVVMDQHLDNHALDESNVSIEASAIVAKGGHGQEKRLNKCIQCEYASSHAGHLRAHLKTHTGEKSNKCSQCDFESYQAGHLRRHLEKHKAERVLDKACAVEILDQIMLL